MNGAGRVFGTHRYTSRENWISRPPPLLRDALQDLHQFAVLDVAELSFIDAAGLRVLAEIADRNGGMQLQNPAPAVQKVLKTCDLEHWIQEQ